MDDGYYLSAYLHIDELARLVEWYPRHDQNISLWEKEGGRVRLVRYWELERTSGRKEHPIPFSTAADAIAVIDYYLGQVGLSSKDLRSIWGTPQIGVAPDARLWELELPYHSLAHLFSAVLLDSQKFYHGTILGLALDGSPDRLFDYGRYYNGDFAGCLVRNGLPEFFSVVSPAMLWFEARTRYGMREGSLMALASASRSRLLGTEAFVAEGGRIFEAAREYLDGVEATIGRLADADEGSAFSGFDERFTEEENRLSMFAKELQAVSMEIVCGEVARIIREYQLSPQDAHLALAGGYALNCPTNTLIMQKFRFKSFIAPPCVSDSGLSLGIALAEFFCRMPRIEFKLEHAYHGETDRDLGSALAEYSEFIEDVKPVDLARAVSDIQEHPVVCFHGAAEIGPRALGNRSLLGDPRRHGPRDELNRIKKRQWWRPVAPVVLEERVTDWFQNAYPSPFMLQTFTVRTNLEHLIPAIVHLDGSARVQTVTKQSSPFLYSLIEAFDRHTGVPILANTSLNDQGEPMINSLGGAIRFALDKGIRVLLLNGERVLLRSKAQAFALTSSRNEGRKERTPASLKRAFEGADPKESEKLLNPHGIPSKYLSLMCRFPELRSIFDVTERDDASRFVALATEIYRRRKEAVIPHTAHYFFLSTLSELLGEDFLSVDG